MQLTAASESWAKMHQADTLYLPTVRVVEAPEALWSSVVVARGASTGQQSTKPRRKNPENCGVFDSLPPFRHSAYDEGFDTAAPVGHALTYETFKYYHDIRGGSPGATQQQEQHSLKMMAEESKQEDALSNDKFTSGLRSMETTHRPMVGAAVAVDLAVAMASCGS